MSVVQLSLYLLSLIMLLVILWLAHRYSGRRNLVFKMSGILVLWIGYIVFLSSSGILLNFSFPPRLPLLVVIPILVLVIVFLNLPTTQHMVQQTPRWIPVGVQGFRIIVELIIYTLFLHEMLPERVTFEGWNYDILVGASALPMALAIAKRSAGRKWIIAWNILALSILAVTVFSFMYSFFLTDYVAEGGSTAVTNMPYILIAAVLMPCAVYFHVFSIKQHSGRI